MSDELNVQAAHVLLDLLTSYDDSAAPETNETAAGVAFERLQEVGAVTASFDDDDVLHVDISGLLGAYGYVAGLAVNGLASAHRLDRVDVIATMRAHLEQER